MNRKVEVAAIQTSEGVRVVIAQQSFGRVVMFTVAEAEALLRILTERTLPAARSLAATGMLPEELREAIREPVPPLDCDAFTTLGRACSLELRHEGEHRALGGLGSTEQWLESMAASLCGDELSSETRCVLQRGHDGPHRGNDRRQWK